MRSRPQLRRMAVFRHRDGHYFTGISRGNHLSCDDCNTIPNAASNNEGDVLRENDEDKLFGRNWRIMSALSSKELGLKMVDYGR